jgi:Dullard-like phosphatase family protein
MSNCPVTQSLRPAIVFDLDETLIWTSQIQPATESISFRVRRRRLFATPRPGLACFLKSISEVFDVYFFTASAPAYANPIIDAIAPGTASDHRFFRENCVAYCGYPVKNLLLLNRPLSSILLVDDSAGSALLQPANLVLISPWEGTKPNDNVLLGHLLPFLLELAPEPDLPKALAHLANRNSRTDLSPLQMPCAGTDLVSLSR